MLKKLNVTGNIQNPLFFWVKICGNFNKYGDSPPPPTKKEKGAPL
jgi:hypothetical protein